MGSLFSNILKTVAGPQEVQKTILEKLVRL